MSAPPDRLTKVWILLLGILSAAGAIWTTYRTFQMDRHGVHTTAIVRYCAELPGVKGRRFEAYSVFQDNNGVEHQITVKGFHPPRTVVPIVYPPGRPDKAIAYEGNQLMLLPFFLACLSMAFLLVRILL